MEEKSVPKSTGYHKFLFTMFGLASLLAWNAILSKLFFFSMHVGGMNPSVSFSFLSITLNITLQFILLWKKNLFSIKGQLIWGLILSAILLILLPAGCVLLETDSIQNYIITGGLVLIFGLINAFLSAGFFGLVSFFPSEMIIAFSTGQGFSGILMNSIEYLVLIFVHDVDTGAWIFFATSVLIIVVVLILLLSAFKSDYFKYYLKPLEEIENKKEILVKDSKQYELEQMETDEPDKKETSFIDMFKLLYDLQLLCSFLYIVTISLFPGVCLMQNFYGMKTFGINSVLAIYNVFDTIGRSLVSNVKPTKKLTYTIILGRGILLFTLIFNYALDKRYHISLNITSTLLVINVVALALTNGMGTSLCFGLAPSLVKDELKGQAGSSMSFFLISGIFIGSCLAFLSKKIMDIIGQN